MSPKGAQRTWSWPLEFNSSSTWDALREGKTLNGIWNMTFHWIQFQEVVCTFFPPPWLIIVLFCFSPSHICTFPYQAWTVQPVINFYFCFLHFIPLFFPPPLFGGYKRQLTGAVSADPPSLFRRLTRAGEAATLAPGDALPSPAYGLLHQLLGVLPIAVGGGALQVRRRSSASHWWRNAALTTYRWNVPQPHHILCINEPIACELSVIK